MRFQERLRKRKYRQYLEEFEACARERINYLENIYRNRDPDLYEWIDLRRQQVRCVREIPKDGLMIRLGLGSRHQTVLLDGREDHRREDDVLVKEARSLIGRCDTLRRVPVCVEIKAGMTLHLIANRASELYNLLLVVTIRAALTYHESYVRILPGFRDPVLCRRTEWLSFLPHCLSGEEISELPDEACILVLLKGAEEVPQQLKNHPRLIRVRLWNGRQAGSEDEKNALSVMMTENFEGLIGGDGARVAIRFDRISTKEAELASRALCRLKSMGEHAVKLPEVYPFFRMFKGSEPDIISNWSHTDVLTSLRVPIGIGEDAQTVFLDAHDKQDGPHGLIAGMTGSGKSELLMTYILSLAAAFPPWEVAFFLIDYKGGGMSSAFRELPHVIGSISNLSGHTVERAFLSIRSENERRQKLFLAHNVNHISDYHRKYREKIATEPLPHIFLIVDEFAELKAEEPEFMQELISLSRVGRSLGIHLLLCTQKPSGSVDATIMTNARFQIALRLQDPLDSKEILRHPDAAHLKNPGRAILRIGNDEIYQTLQCAYALSPAKEEKCIVQKADRFGRTLFSMREEPVLAEREETCMERLLQLIGAAYEKSTKTGDVQTKVQPLWLPELPEILSYSSLQMFLPETGEHLDYGVPVGLWDDPETVRQGILYLNYQNGHHLICGSPHSGKSTLLHTFLFGLLSRKERPDLCILDCGGGMLKDLSQEKCVTYIGEEEIAGAPEVLGQALTGAAGLLIVIDGLGVLLSGGGFALQEQLTELLRSGIRRGIYLIVTANDIAPGEISRMMLSYMDCCFCLKMQDSYRYAEVLKDNRFKGSLRLAPGRGYARVGEKILEFMTCSRDTK